MPLTPPFWYFARRPAEDTNNDNAEVWRVTAADLSETVDADEYEIGHAIYDQANTVWSYSWDWSPAGAVDVTVVAADTTPAAFSFTDVTDQALDTFVWSDPITVAGINSPAAVSVSGGQYRINGGTGTSNNGTVNNGDTVAAGVQASADFETAAEVTVTIGGVSDTFTATTRASALLASESLRALYDSSDLSTLWQDTDGTVAVTAPNQPVRRIDDKSGNGYHLTTRLDNENAIYRADGDLGWVEFDGEESGLEVASRLGIGATPNLTVAMGIRLLAPHTEEQRIFALGSDLFALTAINRFGWTFGNGDYYAAPQELGEDLITSFVYRGTTHANAGVFVGGQAHAVQTNSNPTNASTSTTEQFRLGFAQEWSLNNRAKMRFYGAAILDSSDDIERAAAEEWIGAKLGAALGDGHNPILFVFGPQFEADPSATIQAEFPITVAGLRLADAPISITGGEYRINGGSWVSTSGTVDNDDVVEVRLTTGNGYETLNTATLTIGDWSAPFNVTTRAISATPDAFVFLNLADQATEATVVSNVVTMAGLEADAGVTITGGEYRINAGSWVSTAGTISNGDTLQVRVTTAATAGTDATAEVNVGGRIVTFTAVTAEDGAQVVGIDNGSYFIDGDSITVSGLGEPYDGTYVLPADSPPSYLVEPFLTGASGVGDTLTIHQGLSWGNRPDLTCTLTITRNGTAVTGFDGIAFDTNHSTTAEYTIQAGDDAGTGVVLTIVLSDGTDSDTVTMTLVAPAGQTALIDPSSGLTPTLLNDPLGDGNDYNLYWIYNTSGRTGIAGKLPLSRAGVAHVAMVGGGYSGVALDFSISSVDGSLGRGGAGGEVLDFAPMNLVGNASFYEVGGASALHASGQNYATIAQPGRTVILGRVARPATATTDGSGTYTFNAPADPIFRVGSGGAGAAGNGQAGTGQYTPGGVGGAAATITFGGYTRQLGGGGGGAGHSWTRSGGAGGGGGAGAAANFTTSNPYQPAQDADLGTGSGGGGATSLSTVPGETAGEGAGGGIFIIVRAE